MLGPSNPPAFRVSCCDSLLLSGLAFDNFGAPTRSDKKEKTRRVASKPPNGDTEIQQTHTDIIAGIALEK